MNAEYLLYLLHQLRAESNEIHCHPALYKTASLSLSEQSHLAEYEALTDPRVIEFLQFVVHSIDQLFRIRFVQLRTPLVLILSMLAQVVGNILLSKGMKQILPGSPPETSYLAWDCLSSYGKPVCLGRGLVIDRLFLSIHGSAFLGGS